MSLLHDRTTHATIRWLHKTQPARWTLLAETDPPGSLLTRRASPGSRYDLVGVSTTPGGPTLLAEIKVARSDLLRGLDAQISTYNDAPGVQLRYLVCDVAAVGAGKRASAEASKWLKEGSLGVLADLEARGLPAAWGVLVTIPTSRRVKVVSLRSATRTRDGIGDVRAWRAWVAHVAEVGSRRDFERSAREVRRQVRRSEVGEATP